MERTIRKIQRKINKLPVKKRVAAYTRVSSGKDAMLHSLSAQVSHYSNLIQNNNEWDYGGVYADEAVTGTKDNRIEFQKLLKDCRDGKVDMIITKSISRLARNTVTMLEVVRELKNINVDVYFEKENIHSMSGDGELMLTILASFAQEESRSVSENCKWRIRKGFQQGELINLRFMYGYKIKKGVIEINENEAAVVRMIFNDYINGMGCRLIAKKLIDMNIKKMRCGMWTSVRVLEILKNEKYTGNALLQKKYVKDHLTKKLVINKGNLNKYYVEGTHPAIIDIDTFNKAQEIMKINRIKFQGSQEGGRYPFTSKIECGACGKNYKHKGTNGKSTWICSKHVECGKNYCDSKPISDFELRKISKEILEIKEFDNDVFKKNIEKIRITKSRTAIFVFKDGRVIEKGMV